MFGEDIVKTSSNGMELADFHIFKQGHEKIYEGIYGVNVSKVKEIIKIPNLTELPGVPGYIEGIFGLRGVMIPVVNLAKWTQIVEPESALLKPRVIITEFSSIFIGFIVHETKGIRRINWRDIEPTSFSAGSGALDKDKIIGVTRTGNNEVLFTSDLESMVEDLGAYTPRVELEIGETEEFNGIALILDDGIATRRRVGDMMQQMDFTVIETKDGVKRLNKPKEIAQVYGDNLADHPKIIVSDVEMPQMDGFHFAARVREDERSGEIPLIFSSSLSNEFMNEKDVKEAGGKGCLVKFNTSDFLSEVTRVLKKVQGEE